MANKKYKLADNDYWATDGVYDFGQSKTQRQINSDVATHLSGLDDDVSDLNGALSNIGTTYTDSKSVSVASSAETRTSTITVSKGLYLVTLYGIAYSLSANCILQFAITLGNTIQTAFRISAQSSPNNLYRIPLTAIVNVTEDNSTIASNIYQTSGSAVNTDSRLTAVRLK